MVQPCRRQHSGQEKSLLAPQHLTRKYLKPPPPHFKKVVWSLQIYISTYTILWPTAPVLLLLKEVCDLVVEFGACCAISSGGLYLGDVRNPRA
jgi:hypothetical protein